MEIEDSKNKFIDMAKPILFRYTNTESKKQNEDERWINLLAGSLVLDFMEKETESAKQITDKMKLLSESSGYICIDTSKMEYVEENIESNNR